MRLSKENSKSKKESRYLTLEHVNEVREIKEEPVKQRETELPVSGKAREEMRRDGLTLANAPACLGR